MNANEYAKLASDLYAKAKELKLPPESTDPEKATRLLIAYNLEQAAKIAREAAEFKIRAETAALEAAS